MKFSIEVVKLNFERKILTDEIDDEYYLAQYFTTLLSAFWYRKSYLSNSVISITAFKCGYLYVAKASVIV